jgi:hypothetical protein
MPHPVLLDVSNDGLKICLSMWNAPVGQILATGQHGLLSQSLGS